MEGNILFAIDKTGELYYQLLSSTPLVIHLDLQNYKVTLETAEVCPRLIQIVSYQGCYACATMAVMWFKALSTYLPGTAVVTVEKIMQYTPGIVLLQTEVEYAIQISTEYKCVTDTLCFTASERRSCEGVEFCLDEPIIKLYKGNVYSVHDNANYVTNQNLEGIGGLLNSIFNFSWMGKGTIIIIIVVIIAVPIIPCCMTFFRKQ